LILRRVRRDSIIERDILGYSTFAIFWQQEARCDLM
jgi:hypothetical protein